ncbi:hypothetical protein [Pedobacter agri]|uniref:hypothetical protein n=1 Tax=Pedobacter agri TaxID=454586 RepID=UPI002931649A|nr:hypothetical protein [Pedobacter agri]
MKSILFGILILMFCACKQSKKQVLLKKTEKKLITYYTYGELPPAGYIYYDTVFVMPKYRLKVKNMGGCEPIGVDYDDLEKSNRKTALYMTRQFGKDWANDFETQNRLKIILPTVLAD